MKVILGSNDFFGVPFPLVLVDRFFHIYEDGGRLNLDVFRWDEETRAAIYEVRAGQPLEDSISTNPTAIITFTRAEDGRFLYKFRPKPGISQIFGIVPVDRELEVAIGDRDLVVKDGGHPVATLVRNQFTGLPIGIQVRADGSIAIGVNWLPPGMQLARRS